MKNLDFNIAIHDFTNYVCWKTPLSANWICALKYLVTPSSITGNYSAGVFPIRRAMYNV